MFELFLKMKFGITKLRILQSISLFLCYDLKRYSVVNNMMEY